MTIITFRTDNHHALLSLDVLLLEKNSKHMKKILVPCDFSEPAMEAFQFAVDLASHSGGKVVVLKVIDLPISTYGASIDMPLYTYSPSLLKDLEEEAKKSYKKMFAKFGKGSNNISFVVVHGPTSPMIRDYIVDKKIDLVVMGTHGATGAREFFIGSNTEKIVRFSKVPVFAIHKAITVSSVKNIVFPTSLELNQTDFVKKLKSLQEFFDAKLHILYLNTPFNFIREIELKEYAKHYKFTNCELYIRNDRYEPDGITSFVKEIKGDMLAMATHGRKGLSHFVYGSITEDVVNHVECPIWTCVIKKEK
jgi:nucleotide-binding universal stress UspA family protein